LTIKGKLNSIEDFIPDKIVLEDYNPYPTIKAELTVAGGYFERKKK
jgi:thymidylate synthase